MVIAAIAARQSTPPMTLPAITVVFVGDDVDAGALALVEAAEVVEEVAKTVVEGGRYGGSRRRLVGR